MLKLAIQLDKFLMLCKHLEEQKYDVIVTSIGVNDVTKLISAKSWIKQQKQLFEHIQKRFQPKLIIVSGVPQCNISRLYRIH